jgi:DNA excision repair protein ERCC-5
MGVKGLWRLLLPIGRRISIETLEGKVLAVDASIWLAQFLQAMKDPDTGRTAPSAHLIGFFRRLCRLRFHGIRPVFVFDGAAPEVKRREVARRRRRRDDHFAAAGDAVIHRLAKRLLVENLKKKTKKRLLEQQQQQSQKPSASPVATSVAAAAFDPGFNRGNDDGGQYGEKVDGRTRQNREDLTTITEHAGDPDTAVDDDDDDDENDWGSQERAEVRESDKAEAHGGDDDDEGDDFDDSVHLYGGSGDDDDNGEFDVDLMANLPPSKRKDAVERAQRQRRLRSRREFMPAAANPILFSSIQVTNFLKTCKLNQNINKAAARAAARDNLKNAMASDRATTLELIRERDDMATTQNQCTAAAGISAVAAAATCTTAASCLHLKRRLIKRQAADGGREPDDELSRETRRGNAHRDNGVASKRCRAIFNEEAESESDSDSHARGFYPESSRAAPLAPFLARSDSPILTSYADGSVRSKQERLDYELAVTLQQKTEDENGNGLSRLSQRSFRQPSTSDVIDLADSDCEFTNVGEDDNLPGGFSPEFPRDPLAAANSIKRKLPIPASDARGPTREAQGMMCHHLAASLLETDREIHSPLLPQGHSLPGTEQAAALDVIDLADSDDEVDGDDASVDWEDGLEAPAMDQRIARGWSPLPDERITSPAKNGATEPGASSFGNHLNVADVETSSMIFDNPLGRAERLQCAEFELPADGYLGKSQTDSPGRIANRLGEVGSPRLDRKFEELVSADGTENGGGGGDDADVDWEDGAYASDGTAKDEAKRRQSSGALIFRYDGSHDDWNAQPERPEVDATVAALERGLSTASNLTNWAGVAFRKAIRASGQAGLLSPGTDKSPAPDGRDLAKDKELDVESLSSDRDEPLAASSPTTPAGRQDRSKSKLDDVDSVPSPPGVSMEYFRVEGNKIGEWAEERNARERDMETITDDMREEVIQLLQLFGVPFIGMSRHMSGVFVTCLLRYRT